MTGLVFVDTNVFVYRHDSSDPLKQPRAEQWITLLVRHHSGGLSFQVLQELYATLTRRRLNFDRSQAREMVKLLAEGPIDCPCGRPARAPRIPLPGSCGGAARWLRMERMKRRLGNRVQCTGGAPLPFPSRCSGHLTPPP